MLKPISSEHFEKPESKFRPGPAPQFLWIEIKDHHNRRWCEAGDALLRAMDKLSFPDMWDEVVGGRDQIFPTAARRTVVELVTAHLAKHLSSTPRRLNGQQVVAA
jgi:hypothetical protein